MPKRPQVQQPQPANLSIGQIKVAIPKLERRLEDIRKFDATKASDKDDVSARALEARLDDTLAEVFGHDTLEYNRFHSGDLYAGGYTIGGTPRHEKIAGYEKGKKRAEGMLVAAIDMLNEKIKDAGGPQGLSTPLTLDGCDIHPTLQKACAGLYRDQHYAAAIEAACKVLNVQVQAKSGNYDQDNTSLMERVFSAKNPMLAFNDLKDQYDQDEQQGMMFLYKGTFLAFRNPRAHKLVDDAPQTAFGIVMFIDFLIKMLDKVKE